MYSLTYNDRTIRCFQCKDGVFRLLAKDIGDAIGSTNFSRDFGSHGVKAVTIIVESLLPSLTLNERTSMLATFEETLTYLDTRRKKKQNLCIPLKRFLIEHWEDETTIQANLESDETKETIIQKNLDNIESIESDDTTLFMIDAEKQQLHINNVIVPYAYDEKSNVVFRAMNMCLALEYIDTNKAVGNFCQHNIVSIVYDKSLYHSPDATVLHGYGYDGYWVNELGLYKLVFGSKKPLAEKLQNWIFTTVRPFLNGLQQCAVFNCDIPVNAYQGKVLYLFWLKQLNALKFGVSAHLQKRAMTHGRSFGDVSLVHVIETPYADDIEQSLKIVFKERKWKLNGFIVNGHEQSEILDLSKTSIADVVQSMNDFTERHVEIIQKREREIVERSMEFEREISKRRKTELEFELRKMEIELEIMKYK